MRRVETDECKNTVTQPNRNNKKMLLQFRHSEQLEKTPK